MIKESPILTYQDIKNISAGENNEPLVCLNELSSEIVCQYQKEDMRDFVGENIFVRQSLARRLIKASQQLKKIYPEYSLKVVYGYRHPTIQAKYFSAVKDKLRRESNNFSEEELLSLAHNFVAVPGSAGHPVGGAVDITIESGGQEIDMGTKIADFSDPDLIKTFSKKISGEQLGNRLLLHDLMIKNGFAPFYGEWWHFSYGDKEWAYFYNKKKSLYSEVYFSRFY
jgi:D-alanyl-D-alanine dipeptidase